MAVELDHVVDRLRADPGRTGVLSDFDGTLAPIVADPAASKLITGAAEVLADLAARYRLVAVVSGRPVDFLAGQLPRSVTASGLYGLESLVDGLRLVHPDAEEWTEAVDRAIQRCRSEAPASVLVEPKGLSLTLHFRTDPAQEASVAALAEEVSAATGLTLRAARMSVELHPPIAADKGTAASELAQDLAAVCYLGDDLGDLPAFDALRTLGAGGVEAFSIAVRSEESPAELLGAADMVVDGPAGVLAFLRRL